MDLAILAAHDSHEIGRSVLLDRMVLFLLKNERGLAIVETCGRHLSPFARLCAFKTFVVGLTSSQMVVRLQVLLEAVLVLFK